MALDAQGNAYVTGYANRWISDFITVKYDPAGNVVWTKRYSGPIGGDDKATDIIVDSQGNIYVTGMSQANFTIIGGDYNDFDFATIKYDSEGNQQWVKRYAGTYLEDDWEGGETEKPSADIPSKLYLDKNGYIYVTGTRGLYGVYENDLIDGYGTTVLIKYDPQGNQLFLNKDFCTGLSSSSCQSAFNIDYEGNIYTASGQYNTITKYNPSGIFLWETYNNYAESYKSTAMTFDKQGNILVTGHTYIGDPNYDFALVKYDPDGKLIWMKSYNGPANKYDVALDIALDGQENIYISGRTDISNSTYNYAVVKYDANGNQLWASQYNNLTKQNLRTDAFAVDSQGNSYLTGGEPGNNFMVRYNTAGELAWQKNDVPGGNQYSTPVDIAVDAQGNVYLARTLTSSPKGTNRDLGLIKYNSGGNQVWLKRYNIIGNGISEPVAMALDAQGNVYVTGNSDYDFLTVKYNAQGVQQWVKRYNGAGDLEEYVADLKVDTQGNVYVTGTSGLDFLTIKYDTQGNQAWTKRFNGPNSLDRMSSDQVEGLAVDAQGNVYVTGITGLYYGSEKVATVKYNAQGVQQWVKYYSPVAISQDIPLGIAIDSKSDIIVTNSSRQNNTHDLIKYNANGSELWRTSGTGISEGGIVIDAYDNIYITGSNGGFSTHKYSPQGELNWSKTYNIPAGSTGYPVAIALDAQANVYVTGYTTSNYATIKYNTSGVELWAKRYNSPDDVYSIPVSLAVNSQGNVYVTGNSGTIKYDSQGNQLWLTPYAGNPSAIALDAQNNIVVTGTNIDLNYLTVKYSQSTDPTCTASGSILREVWTNIAGSAISAIPLNITPALSGQLTSFEAPTNFGKYYGQRLRGYLCAPITGTYIFYIAGDDNCELYLSTDDNPANKKRIAHISGVDTAAFSGAKQWNKFPTQKSVAISLTAGKRYYVEALHKEGLYADHLAVGWTLPAATSIDVIQGSVLSPYVPTNTGTISLEKWDNIPGSSVSEIPVNTVPTSISTLTSFEAPSNVGSNYGQRIRGYVHPQESGSYTFYISGDDKCELYLSTDDDPGKKVRIAAVPYFTTAKQWTKYAAQKSVSIPLLAGKKYYIEALHKEGLYEDNLAVGWQTSATAAITVIPGSVLSPFVQTGKISREVWTNVPGSAVSQIPVNTAPASTGELTSFEAPTNAGTNYGQRIRGYVHPQVSGNYTFYIAGDDQCEVWLSTDETAGKKVKIATVPYYTSPRQWTKYTAQKSVAIELQAGRKYYIEALHKEGSYADHLAVGWTQPGQTTIAVIEGKYLSPYLPATPSARMAVAQDVEQQIRVYPNPFDSKLTISIPTQGNYHISMTNNLGTTLYQENRSLTGTLLEMNLQTLSLKAGIYMLRLTAEDGTSKVLKVIKK